MREIGRTGIVGEEVQHAVKIMCPRDCLIITKDADNAIFYRFLVNEVGAFTGHLHKIEGATTEDSKEVQTETLEITATPLPNGLVKVKTGANTDDTVYNSWYQSVYQTPTTEPTEQGQG